MTPLEVNKASRKIERLKPQTFKESEPISRIIWDVCRVSGICLYDIKSKSRKEDYSLPRFVITYRLRELGLGIQKIGKIMNRDHSTIIYYLRKYKELVSIKDRELFEICKKIK